MEDRKGISTICALRWVAVVVIILGMLARPSEGMYEDQVGVWDWYQQYIGKVTHAVFQTSGSKKRVVVATEKNALASLTLRSGETYWRRVLGETDSIQSLDIVAGKYVITLSGGSNVRAWHSPDGALVWETMLPSSSSPTNLVVLPIDINNDRANDLLIFSSEFLYAISSSDGGILWRIDLQPMEDFCLKEIGFSNEGNLYGVGFSGSSGLGVVKIDAHKGEASMPTIAKYSGQLNTTKIVVTKGVAVALNTEGSVVVSVKLGTGQDIVLSATTVSTLVPSGAASIELLSTKIEGAIVVSVHTKLFIVKVDQDGHGLRVYEELTYPAAISDSLEMADENHAVGIVQLVQPGSLSMQVVDANNWSNDALKEIIKLGVHRGSIKSVFLNAYIRTDRSHGYRALVVGEDDSLALLQQGTAVWVREDGLASIVDTYTSELPFDKEGVSVTEVEHDAMDWLKGHWLKLKATLFLANAEDIAAVQALRLHSTDKTKLTRDHNGFRKLLIVLTKSGKLLALHTGDGRIVWSILLSSFSGEMASSLAVPLKILSWEVPHQHALDQNPVILVLGKSGPGSNAPGILSWVDVREGKEIRSVTLSYPVRQAIPLPVTDSSEQRLHLFIDDRLQAYVLPETAKSLSLFTKLKPDVFLHVVDTATGTISGYAIRDRIENRDDFMFSTQKVWSIVFPQETEVISIVVRRRLDEVVNTQAKVLGNRDVLYKYLNKNLIFVATVTPKAAGHIGEATPEEAGLVAYLIDTVTGRILHRVTHPYMQGPVQAVFSENWVVYHYFNLRAHRYEMSVLEFYDQNRLADKGVLQLMMGRHNASAAVSSFSSPNIDVKTQSYFFTFSVKTMTVTSTAKGITSRQVLVGTINDQVLALDKRFFDPRRTPNPTQAEREEGILPLSDSLPTIPQSYVTHAHQVEGLRGIVTIPASLESTCLVFAYGLDLFFTQTAPSRIYDSLTGDFSYALLLLTIVVLVVAILVTWILSERKELAQKWK